MLHALHHLRERPLMLRTCCDCALFLRAHAGELDFDLWKKTLRKVGFMDLASAINALTARWLEIPASVLPQMDKCRNLEDMIADEMPEAPFSFSDAKNHWDILRYKFRRFAVLTKRGRKFFGRSIGEQVFSSIFNNILHPNNFLFRFK
jgi:hypothetical protein